MALPDIAGHSLRNAFQRFLTLILPFLVFLGPMRSSATMLEWDRNRESSVAGYRAYYGTASRSYNVQLDVGSNTLVVISNLTVGATYYFAVKAYTAAGVESDFSREIRYTVPNAAPIARADSYTVGKSAALTINSANGVLHNDFDANGDVLAAVLVTSTSHGSLLLEPNGGFTYLPNSNFAGADYFSYRASDGKATSAVVTATINVSAPPNSAPLARADFFTTTQGTALTASADNGVLLNDTDADGDPLQAVLVSSPANGSVSFELNGGFTYIPRPTFVGTDTFSYRAADGYAASSVALVAIAVSPASAGSISGLDDSYATMAATTLIVGATNGVLQNDGGQSGKQLTALLSSPPGSGAELNLAADGSFTYTPGPVFLGLDTFTYRVTDGRTTSGVVSVSITVSGMFNSAPVSRADFYTTLSNMPLTVVDADGVLKNDTDAETLPLSAVLIRNPVNGSLTFSPAGGFTYTPLPSFVGTDSFTYSASDGEIASSVASVTINVTGPTNESPTAQSDAYTTTRQTRLTVTAQSGVLANDADANTAALIAILETDANHGAVTLDPDGGFTYLPQAGFVGADTFTYSVYDGEDLSPAQSVSITVNDVAGPDARPDFYRCVNRATLQIPAETGVLANDVAQFGTLPEAQLVSTTTHGQLELRPDGSFSYTPHPNFSGEDSFAYLISDGNAVSAVATVLLAVDLSPRAPCVDCFTDLDNFLIAHRTAFRGITRARATMPTNGACIDAGLKTIDAVIRAAGRSKDPQLLAAMGSAEECILESAPQKVEDQNALQATMLPSSWARSASNQLAKIRNALALANAATNTYKRGPLLAGLANLIAQTDRLIATGTVAPESLADRAIHLRLIVAGKQSTQTLQFDAATFSLRDSNENLIANGSYSYSRDSWNHGTLVLSYADLSGTERVVITFTAARWRFVGQQLRGYGTPN